MMRNCVLCAVRCLPGLTHCGTRYCLCHVPHSFSRVPSPVRGSHQHTSDETGQSSACTSHASMAARQPACAWGEQRTPPLRPVSTPERILPHLRPCHCIMPFDTAVLSGVLPCPSTRERTVGFAEKFPRSGSPMRSAPALLGGKLGLRARWRWRGQQQHRGRLHTGGDRAQPEQQCSRRHWQYGGGHGWGASVTAEWEQIKQDHES